MKKKNSVAAFLRIDEWMTSKVTMMLGILSIFLLQNEKSVRSIYLKLAILFVFLVAFLSDSYIVNDIFDMDADKKAGKDKIITRIPLGFAVCLVIVIMIAGTLPFILLAERKLYALILAAAVYFFGFSYSLPGIRFKERGLLGLIECSVAQRCLPLLMILTMIDLQKTQLIFLVAWILISFLDGLRYILIHQIIDEKNDRNSDIKTFVSEKSGNYAKTIKTLFGLEVILCIAATVPIMITQPVLCILVEILYVYMEYCIYKVLNVYAKKDWFVTFDSVPLEAYLNIIMPLTVGLCMIRTSVLMVFYCAFLVALCFKPMLVKLKIAKIYIDSK